MDAMKFVDQYLQYSSSDRKVPDYAVRLGVLQQAVIICGRELPMSIDAMTVNVTNVYRALMSILTDNPVPLRTCSEWVQRGDEP